MLKQEESNHEGVWMCEACDRAPAAFFCKADAASLCATCDADIHSANPLANRHHRVPIYGHDQSGMMSGDDYLGDETTEEGDEDEAASWLLLNQPASGEEVDEYLDLFEYNTNGDNHYCEQFDKQKPELRVTEKSCGGDSVVPVQNHIHYQNFLFGMECDSKPAYNYNSSLAHSVSVSSLDVIVVPESSTMSDISMSHTRQPKGTIELFSNPPIQVPTQLSPLDREARVMRYREKKKNRKFEKTIRYASRKAYAETRPRIKGRFAKRTDVEAEIDQTYPNGFMSDCGYGIVPSF
ncbi:zinc finger protein CONSTANS-LIKE 2-like isoform X2 [Silene latifolia]|uniref:zinc finger protein CONSTANS-LIKE 2-like isoform X2 n=1 Tax=Silene latifolia TaxID=37657 RepID=UPI003D77AB8B